MYLFSRKNQKNIPLDKNDHNGLELGLLPKPPDHKKAQLRKILRWKTIKIDQPIVLENEEQSDRSDQPKTSHDDINKRNKAGKLEESLPRFGPCYIMDKPLMPDTKEIALEHVLKKTSPGEPSKARQIYLAAIRKVEKDAREIYGEEIKCSGPEFRSMMMKDGCFFLQLAFLILGSPEQLGYPSNNLIFGRETNKKDARIWIEAMFFVGNQIPLVVLEELMGQEFFKEIKAKGKWDPPTKLSLCKKVLHELLIMPARAGAGAKPSDLLHALHNFVMGPDPRRSKKFGIFEVEDDDNNVDLEANKHTAEADPLSTFSDKRRNYTSVVKDQQRVFPSAKDLTQSGICIKKLKNGGVRSIDFRSYYFWATLHLPVLPIDEDIEVVFGNLKTYETRQLPKHKREITSYLRFMSDVVQTSKDVKLLKRKGIIQGSLGGEEDDDDEDELPEILSRFSTEDIALTRDFRVLRRRIEDYSPPWGRVKSILNVVALLTLLQTVFTMLAYFSPPRNPALGS